jgi:MFS family permease
VFGGVGMAIGAPIGGLLISSLSWQWIFLINLPVGVIAIVLIRFMLNRKPECNKTASRFDHAGAVLSFIGMFSLLLLLNHGQDFGWLSWQSILLFVLSLGCLGLFFISEKRCSSPLVQIETLRNRHLAWGFVSTVSVTMVLIGFNFLFPFFFDFVRHLDPGKTGLLLMTFPIVTILVSPISGYLCDRGSPRTVSIVSMMLALAAVALFTAFGAGTSYYYIIMSFLIFGIGLALFYTANTALIMSHATQDKAGMFASLLSTVSYIGAALGINLFEMVFSYGFPASSTAAMDTLSQDLLLRSYLNASVFGVIITVFGLITVIISREKSSSTQNN